MRVVNPRFTNSSFLPLIGFIVILFGVVLYFFFASWNTEPDESPFPDIDEAWQKEMDAVAQAGVLPHQASADADRVGKER